MSARAGEFEEFIDKVVTPAVEAQRPVLEGRWRTLKAESPEDGDTAVTTYAFVLEGGDLDEDWDLERLLPLHFGKEEGDRLLEAWAQTFVPVRRWVEAIGESGPGSGQVSWTFNPAGSR